MPQEDSGSHSTPVGVGATQVPLAFTLYSRTRGSSLSSFCHPPPGATSLMTPSEAATFSSPLAPTPAGPQARKRFCVKGSWQALATERVHSAVCVLPESPLCTRGKALDIRVLGPENKVLSGFYRYPHVRGRGPNQGHTGGARPGLSKAPSPGHLLSHPA